MGAAYRTMQHDIFLFCTKKESFYNKVNAYIIDRMIMLKEKKKVKVKTSTKIRFILFRNCFSFSLL